ncbi:single-stranded DNA-binding protein [Actinosynnema sp. NPDC059797]
MAYNETRVTVCGNVASKITHHEVGTGFSRVNFRLFTTERRWDQEQRGWVDGNRMFLSVNCWRSLADNAYASLNRGDPVVVTGRVSIKELRDEGQVRQLVEIEATAIGPNLALCTARPVRLRAAPHEALADLPGGAATADPTPAEALPVMTGAPPATPPPPVTSPPTAPAPAPVDPVSAGPTSADPVPASSSRKRPAPARTGSKRTPPTSDLPAPDLPAADPPLPALPAPEVVVPRREGESALVRPGEAGRPKEVAEVPF